MNVVYCQFRAAQTRQVESARPFGSAGWRVGQRPGVAKLQPEQSAVFATPSCKFPESAKIGRFVEHQIAGLFSVAGPALYLTDNRYGHPTCGPSQMQPVLLTCPMAGSVAQGIRHRRFRNSVFQGYAARQF